MEGLKLTWWQRRRLGKQLRETQDARLYRRTLAVLEIGRGRSIAEVAQGLDVTRQSVYNWTASYAQAHDPRALRGRAPPGASESLDRGSSGGLTVVDGPYARRVRLLRGELDRPVAARRVGARHGPAAFG